MAPGSIDGKPRIYEAEPTDQFCYNFVIQIFLLLTDMPSHVESLTPKFSLLLSSEISVHLAED